MKTLILLFGVLVFCAQCTGGSPSSETQGAQQANAKGTPTPPKTTGTQEQNGKHHIKPGESAALRVYIDPETGEFITPPEREVPAAERLEPRAAFSTSQDGLAEIPSPVPGGGTMVDLKGRFRSPLSATIDSDGKISIEHHSIEMKE